MKAIVRCAAAAVAVSAVVIGGAPATAGPTVDIPTVDAPAQVETVSLAHPVGVKDALEIRAGIAKPILELGLQGINSAGGLFPTPGASPRADALWAETMFSDYFGSKPVVSHIVVPESLSDADVHGMRAQFAQAPPAVATTSSTPKLASIPQLNPDTDASMSAAAVSTSAVQDFDEHFPSIWLGQAFDRVRADVGARAATYNQVKWESASDAYPSNFPDDWGLELGFTLYNDDLTSRTRPACAFDGGDSDDDFWAKVFTAGEGGVWAHDLPADAKPYADSNIQSDPCDENGLEIGVGFPDKLRADVVYTLASETHPGPPRQSRMSASMSMKSNDCNNISLDPGTNCMGLNSTRNPPAGFDGAQILVREDRMWEAPGCFFNADGTSEPVRWSPGELISPTERCLPATR